MSPFHLSQRLSRFFGGAALYLLLTTPCHAVSMKIANAGFDGPTKSNAWTPIAVELQNRDEDAVEGVLHVIQGKDEWAMPTCTARVNLPPNSKKLYHVYVRLRNYGDVGVVLTAGSNLLAQKRLALDILSTEDVLLVSVGS